MKIEDTIKAFKKDSQEMRKKAYKKEQETYAAKIKELLENENEDENNK